MNVFEVVGRTIDGGILLTSNFVEGEYGVIHVFCFDKAKFEANGRKRIDVHMGRGHLLAAAQEPLSYSYRDVQPNKRNGFGTYLPYSLVDLNTISTRKESRFLILRDARSMGGRSISIDKVEGRLGELFRTYEELSQYLVEFLPEIGVPAKYVELLTDSIVTKLESFS